MSPVILPPATSTPPKWSARMRSEELSRYLLEIYGIRLSTGTLACLRVKGAHPTFQYDGRFPVTTPADADAFALARLGGRCASTSDRKAA